MRRLNTNNGHVPNASCVQGLFEALCIRRQVQSLQHFYDIAMVTIPILHLEKLRHRQAKLPKVTISAGKGRPGPATALLLESVTRCTRCPWALQGPTAWAGGARCAGRTMGGSLPGYLCQVRPVLQNPGQKGLQETQGWEERVDVSWHMHVSKQPPWSPNPHSGKQAAAPLPSGTEGEEEASPRGRPHRDNWVPSLREVSPRGL